jgi:outer membrane lipoprotein carrier protein
MKIRTMISALFLLAPLALGADPGVDLKAVLAKLEANFKTVNTYRAKFSQEIKSEQFNKVISSGSGELFYAKPGKMLWRYSQPEPHDYISNGKEFWDYQPSAKQAMKMSIDEAFATNLPKGFLFGMSKLTDEFDVSLAPDQVKTNPEIYHLVLKPKKEQDRILIGTVELMVDAKSYLVKGARLKDSLGNVNELTFSEIKTNPKLDAGMFEFKPGKGVDVIKADDDGTKPKAPATAPGKDKKNK